jgi:hypothetical protein
MHLLLLRSSVMLQMRTLLILLTGYERPGNSSAVVPDPVVRTVPRGAVYYKGYVGRKIGVRRHDKSGLRLMGSRIGRGGDRLADTPKLGRSSGLCVFELVKAVACRWVILRRMNRYVRSSRPVISV